VCGASISWRPSSTPRASRGQGVMAAERAGMSWRPLCSLRRSLSRRAKYMGVLRSLSRRAQCMGRIALASVWGGRAGQGMPPPTPWGGGRACRGCLDAPGPLDCNGLHYSAWSRARQGERARPRAPSAPGLGMGGGPAWYLRAGLGKTHMLRSYHHESTRSHQNSEVKRGWAGLVLG
jgi:hypothetical protein